MEKKKRGLLRVDSIEERSTTWYVMRGSNRDVDMRC